MGIPELFCTTCSRINSFSWSNFFLICSWYFLFPTCVSWSRSKLSKRKNVYFHPKKWWPMENKIFHGNLNFNEVFINWMNLTELSSKDLKLFQTFLESRVSFPVNTKRKKNRRAEFSLDSEKLEWSLTIQGTPSM